MANFFQVAIHFHPCHLQTKMIGTSFCALVGLLLTILNHYFNIPINTLKLGDTASLNNVALNVAVIK